MSVLLVWRLWLISSLLTRSARFLFVFFFNDTATTEIYTLSLHDALPICVLVAGEEVQRVTVVCHLLGAVGARRDRKSTRLNSSHVAISYAVFCLKKKMAVVEEGAVPARSE